MSLEIIEIDYPRRLQNKYCQNSYFIIKNEKGIVGSYQTYELAQKNFVKLRSSMEGNKK